MKGWIKVSMLLTALVLSSTLVLAQQRPSSCLMLRVRDPGTERLVWVVRVRDAQGAVYYPHIKHSARTAVPYNICNEWFRKQAEKAYDKRWHETHDRPKQPRTLYVTPKRPPTSVSN